MFTFADLFAGIGGMRMAFESQCGKCVFTSEIDKFSRQTYAENFEINHPFAGDITKIASKEIPDHDILLAGFPCQPFSFAGKYKGFQDTTRGTLFFEIARILKDKRPRAFLLENVKGLIHHDGGGTFRKILSVLQDELNYEVYYRLIDSCKFVPQHRKRIYIVGFKKKCIFQWKNVKIPNKRPKIGDILEKEVPEKYILSENERGKINLKHNKRRGKGKIAGFYSTIFDESGIARTLMASAKGSNEANFIRMDDGRLRVFTPREKARLMGFPDIFKIHESDLCASKQFGNSVVVPLVSEIAAAMIKILNQGEDYGTGITSD
jgi:DNA (cytosine-5)-methyltransferase 1